MPGFRRWQTFRAMDATDALLLVVDWESQATLVNALRDPQVQLLTEQACRAGMTVLPPCPLVRSFDRQLSGEPSVATLLRVSQSEQPSDEAESRDSLLALQALAAPGSTRLYGARAKDGLTAVCLIDFDTEDGIWHFLDSPLRKNWSHRAGEQDEQETWALNLPRLEYRQEASRPAAELAIPARQSALSVQLSVSEDSTEAHICLQGRVDAHGSALSEKFFRTLIADGCLRLEVDVSGLSGISAEAVGMLTRTARYLKECGGQFVLVDNETRVRKVTRSKHLEAILSR